MIEIDDDAVKACADLVGRTGASQFQIGFVHDNVPVEEAGWYAHAQYRGARLTTTSDYRGPAEAADALSRRILHGGNCGCGKPTTLQDGRDVRKWCRWRREGDRWVSACGRGRT